MSQLTALLYEALFWLFWNFSRNKALIIHVALVCDVYQVETTRNTRGKVKFLSLLH